MINLVKYKENQLHFQRYGKGGKTLLLFHGFGQDHRAFQKWTEVLNDSYTLYAFDLFFHGNSHWHSRQPVEKNDWNDIMGLFLQQEGIEKFGVVGFSLGGKFAMITVERFPSRVNELILLAPDGIKTSFWYSLATYPIALRVLFKSMIMHPDRLYRITKFLRSLKFADAGLLRFAEAQMDTEAKRRRVYFSWVYFRHLTPDLIHLASVMNRHAIPCRLFAGKYDKVIQADRLTAFAKKINAMQFEIVEAGHNDLVAKSVKYIER